MNAPEKVELTADGLSVDTAKYYSTLPMPPKFDNFADERLHRKQRLAAAFRVFSRFGLDEGAAGHITARDPEHPETFWLNPFGVHFSQVKVSNLIRVDHEGNLVEGSHPVNRAAFAIHSKVHQARPDAVAAAHTHGVHGRAFSALGKPLAMINQDVCAFYNDHAVYDDYGGVAMELDEGQRIAQALGPCKACDPAQPRAAHPRRERRRGRLVVLISMERSSPGAVAGRSSGPWPGVAHRSPSESCKLGLQRGRRAILRVGSRSSCCMRGR